MNLGEVCEHGSLASSCLICELTAERAALLSLLGKERDEFGKKETELKAELKKLDCEFDIDHAEMESRCDRWKSFALKAREALGKIARSAPCVKDHMSFNSPDQRCDQQIASEALAAFPTEEK